ncbi:DNA pilot protein [Microvirus sp.]|nr:DNA pilot protein [Microvirus sp.]
MDPIIGGALIGGASSLLGNVLGIGAGNKASEKQHQYNKEIMSIQQGYNLENARQQQEYNKELWNYTNYENQVKHLKAAKLNPALLYGKGGTGGMSANGANIAGTSAVGGNEMAAAAPYVGAGNQMGMTMANLAADIAMKKSAANANDAAAAKNRADAAKTAGVDTELAKAQEELTQAKTKTEESMQLLNTWNTEAKKQAVEQIKVEIDKGNAQLRSLLVQAKIDEATKDVLIDQRLADLQNTLNEGFRILADTAKTRQEEKYFQAMESQGWAKIAQLAKQVASGQITAEAALLQAEKYAEDVANRYDLGKKQIDLGYWNMGVNSVLEATKIATDFVPKPARIIEKITETKKD